MPALLWLPSVLHAAGLTVHEVDGWRTRTSRSYGVDQMQARNIVCHATAGSRKATDAGEIAVLLNGSSTAVAPIAQLYLGKQGHWWVVAAGVCNHIGSANVGGYRGNRYAIGIEASNDNKAEAWPDVQYRSYVTGVAAICRHMGWDASHVYGHKDVSSTGKTDPTFSMPNFRQAVSAVLAGAPIGDDAMTPEQWNRLLYGHPGDPNKAENITRRVAPSMQSLHEQNTVTLAKLAGLTTAVEQLAAALATGTGVDPAAIRAAVEDGVDAALARAGAALAGEQG